MLNLQILHFLHKNEYLKEMRSWKLLLTYCDLVSRIIDFFFVVVVYFLEVEVSILTINVMKPLFLKNKAVLILN